MTTNPSTPQYWEWTSQREEAAVLVAADYLTEKKIAARVGIAARTLRGWKQSDAFKARIAEIRDVFRAEVRVRGIADLDNRIAASDRRWRLMHQVIEERGERYTRLRALEAAGKLDTPDLPEDGEEIVSEEGENEEGGATEPIATSIPAEAETGLVILEKTYTKHGVIEKWAVDTPLLAEIRAHEQQAAKELGQWTEKQQVTATMSTVPPDLSVYTDEELELLERIAAKSR